MDFTLDETQRDLRALAEGVLAKEATPERGGRPYDEKTWRAMTETGLADVCVPEEAGGAGQGAVEMAVVLREVGARAAPVPALGHLAGTLALARYGRAVEGLVTVAAQGSGRRFRSVPYAAQADHILIAADDGVHLARNPALTPEFTATGEPAATVAFERADRIADDPAPLRTLMRIAIAAQAGGVLAGALKLTTDHVKARRQFGRALAEFQAVTMQVADVYIASRALDVAMWAAAWGGDETDAAVAAFHVSEAFKALYTCQHLHGGLGLDVTYPLHRYFAQAKHLAHLLGGADAQLDLIGALAR
ncbi:acyl-CoA dehydrogenase family protein [Thermoactinospora rubra]|uniref:acyl-CoA dehydrogenase family protein n=1 Tax=Thermoactinospora rubra TaxID=1088767 RepID=UPI000A0F64CB|nr:acyl-CoA dehydrogenase family protein [Thermoactinospora rubra]